MKYSWCARNLNTRAYWAHNIKVDARKVADHLLVKQIKVFDQTLDRKKALQLEKSLLFIFDIVRRHSNFSKHTGSFATAMLRKDRITIYD